MADFTRLLLPSVSAATREDSSFRASLGEAVPVSQGQGSRGCRCEHRCAPVVALARGLRGSAQLALLTGCYILSPSQPPRSAPHFLHPKSLPSASPAPRGPLNHPLQKRPPVARAPQPGGPHLLSCLHLSQMLSLGWRSLRNSPRLLSQLPSWMPAFLPSFLPFSKAS